VLGDDKKKIYGECSAKGGGMNPHPRESFKRELKGIGYRGTEVESRTL